MKTTGHHSRATAPSSRGAVRMAWLGLLAAVMVLAWFGRIPVRNFVLAQGVMRNDAPTDDAIEQVINSAKDPQTAVRALWATGKIVHREVAIRQLARLLPTGQAVPAGLDSLVLAAALDPDVDVREGGFGILREHHHPALAALAVAQLQDHDPEVRELGLSNLKPATAAIGVPSVIPLLNDADPQIIVMTLNLLEHWTGQSFGVRLSDAVPVESKLTGRIEFGEESKTKAEAGAQRAKAWWAQHQAEYPPVHFPVPDGATAARQLISAGDFTLATLDGRQVRLSDFRGKVVLINFWATWCTSCVGEIPELIDLQKRHHDQLAILGISLDQFADEDVYPNPADRPSPEGIRKLVARVVKTRGINYPVLLDETDAVGGRFNGGELPTTVIVDAQGNVRRRFVGARPLPVLEAMIDEASQSVAH